MGWKGGNTKKASGRRRKTGGRRHKAQDDIQTTSHDRTVELLTWRAEDFEGLFYDRKRPCCYLRVIEVAGYLQLDDSLAETFGEGL